MQSRDKITDEEIQRIFIEGQRELKRRRLVEGDSLSIPIPHTWEYGSSDNLEFIVQEAVRLGWKDNKVQVKRYDLNGKYTFYIEPYEEGCNCPGLLKYEDYVIGE